MISSWLVINKHTNKVIEMKNYYATVKGYLVTENIYEGNILRYEANSEPYCDLKRFSSKKERDEFVGESNDHESITVKEIKEDAHINQQL